MTRSMKSGLDLDFLTIFSLWIIHQILVEVDQLHSVEGSYLQIKGANKEVISAAASVLSLEGSYTTKVC